MEKALHVKYEMSGVKEGDWPRLRGRGREYYRGNG